MRYMWKEKTLSRKTIHDSDWRQSGPWGTGGCQGVGARMDAAVGH